MNKWSVKRIALSALLIAVMLILRYISSIIPLGPVPGIKLGLSNSVLLLGLCWLGIPATFVLMFAKVLLFRFIVFWSKCDALLVSRRIAQHVGDVATIPIRFFQQGDNRNGWRPSS